MKNIYNKGVYRDSQWRKHLSPFLKKICNRKWRRTANKQISAHLEGGKTGPSTESDNMEGITKEQLDELNQ